MKKLNTMVKIFLTIIFVLPFLLQLYSIFVNKDYVMIFVPLFFMFFSLYCIWFDKQKENEAKIKGLIFTFLQFMTCLVWLSVIMVYVCFMGR